MQLPAVFLRLWEQQDNGPGKICWPAGAELEIWECPPASKGQLRKGGLPTPHPGWKSGILLEDIYLRDSPDMWQQLVVWQQLVWKNFTLYFLLLLPGAIKKEIPPVQLRSCRRMIWAVLREERVNLRSWSSSLDSSALLCSGFPNSWVPKESQLLGRAWNQPQTPALKLSRSQRRQHCREIPP